MEVLNDLGASLDEPGNQEGRATAVIETNTRRVKVSLEGRVSLGLNSFATDSEESDVSSLVNGEVVISELEGRFNRILQIRGRA